MSLLENVTEAIKQTLGRLLRPSESGPSPDEEVAAEWGRVDQKKDQVWWPSQLNKFYILSLPKNSACPSSGTHISLSML